MFTRFIELVFGLCVALYLLGQRFGVAGCVRAFRHADPHLLLAVSAAVVFLLMVLAAQSYVRWHKERERKLKERQRETERQRKAADRAAKQNADTEVPAATAADRTARQNADTVVPATTATPDPDPAPTAGDPPAPAACPRYLRRHAMPSLLDSLMPDATDMELTRPMTLPGTDPAADSAAGDDDDDLFQIVADPAAGDDYVI